MALQAPIRYSSGHHDDLQDEYINLYQDATVGGEDSQYPEYSYQELSLDSFLENDIGARGFDSDQTFMPHSANRLEYWYYNPADGPATRWENDQSYQYYDNEHTFSQDCTIAGQYTAEQYDEADVNCLAADFESSQARFVSVLQMNWINR